ncbi:hypothetical protein RFI_12746 [Reticulomyxa filosa]|uniref:EF-hand domain-containing protein n=1 Tax=Reticulomyxa filosa TaxID=46433 RepID=X6NDN1_RETFI|nr:hypothetical protein RFI_12746 [Reticulomyxa filosa]|eukprot:ETO24410.1 hypothetical protein RFI_12746 [Reticulomyxa filosa]
MKDKIDMLFEMYALNGQEYITKEQLRVVLFSLVTPTSSIFYSDDPTRTIGGSKVELQMPTHTKHIKSTTNNIYFSTQQKNFAFKKIQSC